MKFSSRLFKLCLIVLTVAALTGCDKHDSKKASANSQASNNATAVSVIMAKPQNLQIKYESSGSLEPITNPTITAEIAGRVNQVNTYAGAEVQANQVLALLDHQKAEISYQQAKAKLTSAEAELQAKTLEEKSRVQLVKKGIVSKLHFEKSKAEVSVAQARVAEMKQNLLAAENSLERTVVRSPIDGHVEKVSISQGDYLTVGKPMFKIINRSLLQARLPFSQERAGEFKIGQQVRLVSPATPGKEYIGQITAITPSINPTNRSLDVIITFNSDELWHAGASIRGHVYLEEKKNVIMIPVESIVLRDNRNLVFTVKDNKAVEHSVSIIQEDNSTAAIQGNIKSGDKIVVHGAQYLSNGASVSVKK